MMLVGAVYENGAFHLYVIDPVQLSFTEIADTAHISSPFTVNAELAQAYWEEAAGAPVAETLQEAREYADTLEVKYGVRILLSDQCRDAAALCEYPITLTDALGTDELSSILLALERLCFVDGYAQVDEHEDRTRIMEYFMTHTDEAKLLIQSPAIRQKLQRMCDAIRNNFDTSGWDSVRWEELL